VFSTLSTKKTEAATVSVDRYLPSIVRVYQAAKRLQGMNQSSEETDIEGYIYSLNVITEEFASQELLTGTDQEKLALLKDYLQQNTVINSNSTLQALITKMDYESIAALQQDLKVMTELSSLLKEKEMLSDILNYTSELSPQELIERIDEDFIVQIADLLYSMDQAELIVPLMTEKLLGLLLEDGGVGSDALNQIENFGDTKQEFIEVCQSGKQLAYLMNYEVDEIEAMNFLKDSLTVIRNSKLIHKETLQELEQILANRLKLYHELP
jgi:Mg/Co/Ni transporter MgtE